jgi:zinc transport system substrate-binding protein
VAVSIKPVHSLVAGVMEGAGAPFLIVDGAATPHDFALKPSAARVLSRADLIFWVGPGFESFLARPLAALAQDARVVTLTRDSGISLLDPDEEGDLHLWLDPGNARAITETAVRELSRLDPGNAALYRRNGEKVISRIGALERELAERLAPLAGIPYMVYYDAFGYLERAFGLKAAGYASAGHEERPGAKSLAEARRILGAGVRCLFGDPGASPRLMAAMVSGLQVKSGILDPLGAAMEAGPEHYFRLMRANADALVRCLSGGG